MERPTEPRKGREFSGRVQIDLYLESSEERRGPDAAELKRQLEVLLAQFTSEVQQPARTYIELTQGVWRVDFPLAP